MDLSDTVESAIRMAHGEIRHRARLIRNFEDDLPLVEANESKLVQVFLNLLINAVHALDVGEVDQDLITVNVYSRDQRVIVEFIDTGSGMLEEVLDRIFDPFFTTKPPGQGTGLGLSICQKIIQANEGVITVQSEVGEGTTFRVSFPEARGETSDASMPEMNESSEMPKDSVSPRKKILVIDDDKMVGKTLERCLESEHDIKVSADPNDLFEALSQGENFDVVFCDLMMPNITGMDVYARLSEEHPEMLGRIIFMTGGAFTPRADNFLAEVDPPLMMKPFDLDEIYERIEKIEREGSFGEAVVDIQ